MRNKKENVLGWIGERRGNKTEDAGGKVEASIHPGGQESLMSTDFLF